MNEIASSIVERIRGALLQGSPDREALHRLADAHAAEVGKANTLLARCHRWSHRGCVTEAASLAEAVHLVPAAVALRLEGLLEPWSRLLKAASLPPPPEIDVALLESLVASIGRTQSLAPQLAAMRLSFLRRAPLPERLQLLHELADRDPRQPAWLEGVRRVEREAVAALAEAGREAERAGDAALAGEVVGRVESMRLRIDGHEDLFARVRSIAEAERTLLAQARLQACVDALHEAASAMDMERLAAAAAEWERLVSQGEPGETLLREAQGPLDLHRREMERRDLARRRSHALAQLELALDEARDVAELDRLADTVDRLDAEWPAALRGRLQDRRAQRDAARARRRVIRGSMAALAVFLVATAAWFGWRSWSAEHRFDDAIAESDRLTAIGEIDAAASVLDAIAADVTQADRPELAGARLRVANARDRARAADAAVNELVARLDRLAADGGDPVAMEAAANESLGAIEAHPAARRDSVRAAVSRLQAAATAARDRALDASRGAVHELTRRLGSVSDPKRSTAGPLDQSAWIATAEAYESIVRDARAAASAAGSQRDGQAVAEALQALATEAAQRGSKARARADRIESVRTTLRRIERTIDEQECLELWEQLLRDGGDVLADQGMLRSSEDARDAARSALGIRAWRAVVIPLVLAGRGDVQRGIDALDWGDAATARTLDSALTRHLDEHPSSPYRPVAERLRGLARRTIGTTGTETSLGAATRAAIAATGYAGLLEQGFDGGRTLYRRGTEQPPTAWGQAIESKRDLERDPASLAPRRPPSYRATGSPRPWAGSQAVDRALVELQGADGRTARDATLRMLSSLRSASGGDPVLHWHAMRDLWRIWLQHFADETDPEDAAAARWVRSLDGVTALLGEDPILLGASESGARADGLRRQALDQLAKAFDASRLLNASQRRDAAVTAGVRPLAPLGVLLPGDGDALTLKTAEEGVRGAVPRREGDAWRLVPLRIERDVAVWDGAQPEPRIRWPQVFFIPGGAP